MDPLLFKPFEEESLQNFTKYIQSSKEKSLFDDSDTDQTDKEMQSKSFLQINKLIMQYPKESCITFKKIKVREGSYFLLHLPHINSDMTITDNRSYFRNWFYDLKKSPKQNIKMTFLALNIVKNEDQANQISLHWDYFVQYGDQLVKIESIDDADTFIQN